MASDRMRPALVSSECPRHARQFAAVPKTGIVAGPATCRASAARDFTVDDQIFTKIFAQCVYGTTGERCRHKTSNDRFIYIGLYCPNVSIHSQRLSWACRYGDGRSTKKWLSDSLPAAIIKKSSPNRSTPYIFYHFLIWVPVVRCSRS